MKVDELKTMIGEVLKEQIDALKQPAARKAFIDEAGGPSEADKYLKAANFYGKVLGFQGKEGAEVKAITDDIVYTGANGQGGYLEAPAEVMAEIARIEKDASAVMRLARIFDQKPDTLYVPTDTSDLTVTWAVAEAAQKTTTKPTFTRATLSLQKAALLVVISDEMISGSVVNIVDYLNQRIAEDFGESIDTAVLGASASSPFDNIAHVSGTNSVSLPADGPDFDSVVAATASIKSKAARRARFFMNRTVFAEFRKVKGTDGQPIFQAPMAGAPGMLMGYPVELVETMPTYSGASTGEMVALFGDLGYWYMGRHKALNIGVSRDAAVTLDSTLTSLWEHNLVGIRAEARYSGALVLPSAFCKICLA